MEGVEWTLIVGVCVLVAVLLVVYRVGYIRGWNAHSLLVWKADAARIKELREGRAVPLTEGTTKGGMKSYKPVTGRPVDPPKGGSGVPNRNIKPPKYDVVTEGYDPAKVREDT